MQKTTDKKSQIDFITLGCSKNLVDTELLMKQFEANGYHCVHDSKRPKGDIAVINTCGFIESAKEESINTILEFAQAKEEGRLQKLFVMGCLSQRYREDLCKEIPQVDKFYGKFDYKQLLKDLGQAEVPACNGKRKLTTPHHYAYIKISEGCNRRCAYCAIPLITGRHHSRPMDEIVEEVESLVASGVKEFQLIAQELTAYGTDMPGGQQMIADLVERISDIKGVKWIRLHYAYPTHFPQRLLDVIRERKNVCKYIDIALQHISDKMLSAMKRDLSSDETYKLIEDFRKKVPGIHLRTTLMVGFPGETEDDFEQLMAFVKWARFERMGAFAYSEEEGTYSASHYREDVPEEVKQQRLDRLMALQQQISAEIEESKVGMTLTVIIDRKEGDFYVGRTEFSSPEVDPEVLIPVESKKLRTGAMYQVLIKAAEAFDLFGEVV